MMRSLARRTLLKGIAASPAAAFVAAEQAKVAMLNAGSISGVLEAPSSQSALQFTSFRAWFDKFGHTNTERQARLQSTHGFDPDILEMRLPMSTKTRMQYARCYARELAERQTWFERTLISNGVVKWWA